MTDRHPLASIVITSYNYGRFLKEAIDSALGQSYLHTEVIVVDDGSSDDSPAIIAGYGDRIVAVYKKNGGQASAFNEGFRRSAGKIVCFLDSDDALCPTAIELAMCRFHDDHVAKVHWPLWIVDGHSIKTGAIMPPDELSDGDLREQAINDGPDSHVWPPTSGNAWARHFLEKVLPMPEEEYRLCADAYLAALAPATGPVRRIDEPQGFYRLHGQNNYWEKPFDEMMRLGCAVFEKECVALSNYLARSGIQGDIGRWISQSWWHRIRRSLQTIAGLIPEADTLILVDDDKWSVDESVAGRRYIPFLEHAGQYWGPPPDDATAIRELERLRGSGARWIVFGWPAFWWLEHYTELRHYLNTRYYRVQADECSAIFDLH